MSLDDDRMSARDALLLDRERDWADQKAAWDEQRACESIEAEEGRWRGIFAAMPDHIRAILYEGDR